MQSRTRRSLSVLAVASLVALSLSGCALTRPSIAGAAGQLREALDGFEAVSAVTVLEDEPESSYWNFPGGSPRAIGVVEVELDDSWEEDVSDVGTAIQQFLVGADDDRAALLSVVISTPTGVVGVTESPAETAARLALMQSLGADRGVTEARIAYPDIRPGDGDEIPFIIEMAPGAGLVDTFDRHEVALKAAAEASEASVTLFVVDDIPADMTAAVEFASAPMVGTRYLETRLSTRTTAAEFAFADGVEKTDGVVGWHMTWGRTTVLVGASDQLTAVRDALRALPEFAQTDDDGFSIVTGLELSVGNGGFRVDSEVAPDSPEYRFGVALSEAGAEQVRVSVGAIRLGSHDGARLQQLVEVAVPVAPDAGHVLLTTSIADIEIRDVPIDFTMLILPDLLAVDPDTYREMSVTAEHGYMVELGTGGDPSGFLSAVYIPAVVEGMPVIVSQKWNGPSVSFIGAERISEADLMAFEGHETSAELNAAVLDIWNELVLPEPTVP